MGQNDKRLEARALIFYKMFTSFHEQIFPTLDVSDALTEFFVYYKNPKNMDQALDDAINEEENGRPFSGDWLGHEARKRLREFCDD